MAVMGCGAPGSESKNADCETSTIFTAITATFQPFRTWEAFPLTTTAIAGSPHTSGPRTVYLNEAPPHGSTHFPVGTVIVKEFSMGAFDQRQVFAMVKRGGCYNENGATNWEWFELVNSADGTSSSILWRGVSAPAGEMYAGAPNSCNECHGTARTNDFVQAAPLDLANF